MQRQEGGAKAGGEGWRRLRDAALGTGQLGGEARQEVVLGLVGGQTRNRRQNAKGVSGEEDNLGGMTGFGDGLNDVLDMIDRIRDAGVFGL